MLRLLSIHFTFFFSRRVFYFCTTQKRYLIVINIAFLIQIMCVAHVVNRYSSKSIIVGFACARERRNTTQDVEPHKQSTYDTEWCRSKRPRHIDFCGWLNITHRLVMTLFFFVVVFLTKSAWKFMTRGTTL